MSEQDNTSIPAQEPVIEQELLNKVSALRAIVTTHNLLQEGNFNLAAMPALQASVEFLKSLHAQVSEDALKHPQADLIEDLKQLKSHQGE